MEAAGAVDIFCRSVEKHNLRYLEYLGDRDTEAFLKVAESKPYGDGVTINKLECVCHFRKHVGTRLRKLRSEYKGRKLSDSKFLTGTGRLTDVAINSLQNYFGMAIRQNSGQLYAMEKAIGAVLFHCSDLDESDRHKFCPQTMNSWCKWQNDKINNSKSYKAKINLPQAIKILIESIFRELSKDELLKKCLHGRTQNPNEAYQILWITEYHLIRFRKVLWLRTSHQVPLICQKKDCKGNARLL